MVLAESEIERIMRHSVVAHVDEQLMGITKRSQRLREATGQRFGSVAKLCVEYDPEATRAIDDMQANRYLRGLLYVAIGAPQHKILENANACLDSERQIERYDGAYLLGRAGEAAHIPETVFGEAVVDEAALLHKARLLAAADRPEQAAEMIDDLEGTGIVHEELAYAFARVGNQPESLHHLKEFQATASWQETVCALANLDGFWPQRQMLAVAEDIFEAARAKHLHESDHLGWAALAHAYANRGEYITALEHAQRIVKLGTKIITFNGIKRISGESAIKPLPYRAVPWLNNVSAREAS